MFRGEVTKMIHRFRSSRGTFYRVNTSFIFTVFLSFISYHSTKMTPLFKGRKRYVFTDRFFGFPPLLIKSQQSALKVACPCLL